MNIRLKIVLKTSAALIIIFAASLLWPKVTPAAEQPQQPNIVFIYADDWRWDAIGAVQREQGERARFPWLKTPNLDRFATGATRFRNAFVVNSLCSPGRACVLTGRYSHLNGIIGNSTPLPTSTDNFAKHLQQAGYNTGYCGKFHMGSQQERPGFDYVASFVGQGKYYDCPILLNGKRTSTEGWIDNVSTDYAIKFLDQQSKKKPFMLWIGFKSPHGPRGGKNLPEKFRNLYAGESPRPVPNNDLQPIFQKPNTQTPNPAETPAVFKAEGYRDYMRHITAIDSCIGRLLEALDRNGQAGNTMVVITSDNGYYLGEHQLGDKRSAYEESIRVPLMIRVPGATDSTGSVNDNLVLNIDHSATFTDYASAKQMAEGQGRSLRPLLTGDKSAKWRDAFFYEYFKEPQYASPTVLAVRTATAKMITYPGHDDWTEIYELASDPYETKNEVDDVVLLKTLKKTFEAEANAVNFVMPDIPTKPVRKNARRRRQKRRPIDSRPSDNQRATPQAAVNE